MCVLQSVSWQAPGAARALPQPGSSAGRDRRVDASERDAGRAASAGASQVRATSLGADACAHYAA